MLRIRQNQMEHLGRESFVERMLRFLVEEYPEVRNVGSNELESEVRRQLANGISYGLETEWHVAKYITMAWLLGTDFDTQHEAVETILTAADLDPDQKVEKLEQWLRAMAEALTMESS